MHFTTQRATYTNLKPKKLTISGTWKIFPQSLFYFFLKFLQFFSLYRDKNTFLVPQIRPNLPFYPFVILLFFDFSPPNVEILVFDIL